MDLIPLFKDIKNFSKLVEENDFFKQYTNEDLSDFYEANYLVFKFSPILEEFKIIEKMHIEYQCAINQTFLNFYWPQNKGITLDTLNYLDQQNYKIGMQYLYYFKNDSSYKNSQNESIRIRSVDSNVFPQFLTLNYIEDIKYGEKFANDRKRLYTYQFPYPNTEFILAHLNNQPAGIMTLIHSDDFLEIANLLTTENYRNKRVATNLINYAKEIASNNNKILILITDAEDTPKNMYENMGFKYISSQINARKELTD